VADRVLVIEDDALIASSLERALAANGYAARVVGSVADGVAAIDAEPPDLILLDLGLPDGDGAEVAEHAARDHPSIPVIVLTARAEEIDIVLGLEAGAVDYVVKPFRLAELLARVSSHLRLTKAIGDRAEGREPIAVDD
jgi:DNA-binding response OmpR family regulator